MLNVIPSSSYGSFYCSGDKINELSAAYQSDNHDSITGADFGNRFLVHNQPESNSDFNDRSRQIYILKTKTAGLDDARLRIFNDLDILIEEYLNSKEILVSIPMESLSLINEVAFVGSIMEFDKEQKYDHMISEIVGNHYANIDNAGFEFDDPVPILITLFETQTRSGDMEFVLAELNKVCIDAEIITPALIAAKVKVHDLDVIAELDRVKWLEYDPPYTVYNDVAAGIIDAPTMWQDLAYNGSGQIVGVFDVGLDWGVDNESMHKDFKGKILNIRNYYGTGADDKHGHGTHVAGTLLGNGTRSNGVYKGIAHGADLVFQAGGDDAGTISIYPPSNLLTLLQDAYNDGARIHSNSWGAELKGAYNTRSRDVDDFIWTRNNFTVVIAAGNDGALSYTVSAPGTAKNAITVGATENYRPSKGGAADDIDDIYSISGRGPTIDGRIKPDVMAPGTWILSTRTNKSLVTIPSGNYWGEFDDYYAYAGGTSMATPIVSGAAAILRQYYIENRSIEPSAALIKATLINGAEDIGTPNIPNFDEGWGRINVSRSIQADSPGMLKYIDNKNGLTDGENKSFQFDVLDNSLPFKVTLVWTDYKGSVSNDGELINDLDLIVENNESGRYLGNQFTNGWSMNDTLTPDTDNNVECVYIKTPVDGRYNITISGTGISSGPQNFALVVTGVLRDSSLLPPSGVKVTPHPEGKRLNITWWPNLGTYTKSYRLYRSNVTPDDFKLIAEIPQSTSPWFLDSGLNNDVPYFYKLTTVDTGDFESEFSRIASGIPDDCTPPAVVMTNPQKDAKIRNNVTLEYTAANDTIYVSFKYYIDSNHDRIPNDGNTWIIIGIDNSPADGYYWNTTSAAHGPGDAHSVILNATSQDESGNNYTLYITGLLIDNTNPQSPIMSPVTPNPLKSPNIQVTGTSEPNSTVELFNNDAFAGEQNTNYTGNFNIQITLVEGFNNLSVRAIDEVGNGPGPLSAPQVVVLDNKPPHVDPGGPYSINIGTSFILNSSGTHDFNKNTTYYYITNYTWIVEKNFLTYYFGEAPLITLYEFGKYTLTLKITDAAGNVASSSTYIDIIDTIVPVSNAGGDRIVNEDEWISFDVYNSSDNNPDFFTIAIFKWTIISPQNDTYTTYERNFSYIFYNVGVYEIILSATDAHNNTGTDTIYITVNDITPPLARSGGDRVAVEFHPITFDANGSSDNDPDFSQTGEFKWTFIDTGGLVVLRGKIVSYTFIAVGIYDINLTVTDGAGNSNFDVFQVSVIDDTEPPSIVSVFPEEFAVEVPKDVEIRCKFSEPIKDITINFQSYYLTDSDGNKIPGDLTYDPKLNMITLTPSNLLSSNQIYYGYVKNSIMDLAGNYIAFDYSWYFSTVSPPTIIQIRPEPDSSNIQPPPEISIVFSEPLLSKSVTNPIALKLFDEFGSEIPGLIHYENDTFTIQFVPDKGLNYSTDYKIELTNTIFDLQGNRLESNHTWYFSTGPPLKEADKLSNVIVFSITFAILILIIIIVILTGTGKLKIRKAKEEEPSEDEEEVEELSYRDSREYRERRKVQAREKRRAGTRGHPHKRSRKDDDDFEEYEDELEEGWDNDFESDYELPENDFYGEGAEPGLKLVWEDEEE
ncbi:MAG: S8 family serine peptidase [Thermoplasmata archaeon]|nr:MAG: S8 family serine peptidase [Thermoplasmata archaeon]